MCPIRWPRPPAHGRREAVRAALLASSGSGRVFDLDIGRFPGMPHHPAQPGFDVATYLSPQRVAQRPAGGKGPPPWTRTILAWCWRTSPRACIWGPTSTPSATSPPGPTATATAVSRGRARRRRGRPGLDVADVPPIIARGVLLDVAALLGAPKLAPGYAIDAEVSAGSPGRREDTTRATSSLCTQATCGIGPITSSARSPGSAWRRPCGWPSTSLLPSAAITRPSR